MSKVVMCKVQIIVATIRNEGGLPTSVFQELVSVPLDDELVMGMDNAEMNEFVDAVIKELDKRHPDRSVTLLSHFVDFENENLPIEDGFGDKVFTAMTEDLKMKSITSSLKSN